MMGLKSYLPNIFESIVAFSVVILWQQNGLAKSSSITAAIAFSPEETVLK